MVPRDNRPETPVRGAIRELSPVPVLVPAPAPAGTSASAPTPDLSPDLVPAPGPEYSSAPPSTPMATSSPTPAPEPSPGPASGNAPVVAYIRGDAGCLGSDLRVLIREELAVVRAELRGELANVRADIQCLRDAFSNVEGALMAIEGRVGSLERRVEVVERQLTERAVAAGTDVLEAAIADLQGQLNDRDQELLANDVQISNILEESNENLLHIVTSLGIKLGVSLDERDVVTAVRMGAKRESGLPRPIVVRLARRATRDQLLSAARVRRSPTTADLSSNGVPAPPPPRSFYVNERLTRLNRQLFGKARERARQLKWKYVWTKEGRVYVRRAEGAEGHRIRSEADIDRIFQVAAEVTNTANTSSM